MSQQANWREALGTWINSPGVQNLVLVVIVINSITIGLETAASRDGALYFVLHTIDLVALVIFCLEIGLKLIASGPRFFRHGWNLFDFFVVAIALVPGAGPLTVLRTMRILRLLRVIKFMPQLRRVVEALLRSLPGIGAIGLLMVLIFYVAAVMATVMFGHAFPEWFGSIGASLYTLFQIMTLESWSMGIVRPVMAEVPWAWAFFVPFILVSAFTMLNLFIAVIVDTMGQMGAPEDHDATTGEVSEVLAEVRALRAELAELRGGALDPIRMGHYAGLEPAGEPTSVGAEGATAPESLRP